MSSIVRKKTQEQIKNTIFIEVGLEFERQTHAVCRWDSSWPGTAAYLHKRCRDTDVYKAGWVCLAHLTNTQRTRRCCHWSHHQQPADENPDFKESSHKKNSNSQIWESFIYLWFLTVVFVLYPIDFLQQVAHSIHLGQEHRTFFLFFQSIKMQQFNSLALCWSLRGN